LRRLQLTPHLTICLMGFSMVASTSVVVPILSIYVKDVMGASVEMVGLVTAAFFMASALTKAPVGLLIGGRRTFPLLMAASLIFALCPAFYPLVGSVGMLILLRSARGFTYTVIGATALLMAGLTLPSAERDRGFGTYTASLSLGLLAGPAITAFSIPIFGISNTFYFASVLGLVGVFAAVFLYVKVSSIEGSWQIIGVAVEREGLRSKVSNVARNGRFQVALVGNFAFFLIMGAISAYAPLHARENLGFSDGAVPMLFLLYYVATTATRFSMVRMAGRASRSTLVILSTGSAAMLSLALSAVRGGLAFAAILALIGAVQGVIIPAGSMLIAESIQPSRRALANSLYLMGLDVGQGMAPLITAEAAARHGLGYSFMIPAAVSAGATLAILWLSRRSSR